MDRIYLVNSVNPVILSLALPKKSGNKLLCATSVFSVSPWFAIS
jgi:hypothetical protein